MMAPRLTAWRALDTVSACDIEVAGQLKILITSVGSLVGQNILDALEGRREGMRVIGVNSLAEAASNFRCDVCYMAPRASNEEEYRTRLLEIMESERPDLVLAGRDDDVIALALIREESARFAAGISCGSSEAARVMDDKLLSYHFARKRGLPFADTACGDMVDLMQLAARCGYPLIAKPRRGNGSRGALLIQNEGQLARAATLTDYVFQEYINPPSDLDAFVPDHGFGVPLFHSLPELWKYSLQAVIAPSGQVIDTYFCTANVLVNGRTEQATYANDPDLIDAIRRYAVALADIGWVGPLNLQGRRTEDGRFVAFELNGRMGGVISGYLRLGFDELGIVAHYFAGAQRLAASPILGGTGVTVYKSLCDFPVKHEDAAILKENGAWQRFA